MKHPGILAIGTANPPYRFTQEQVYRMAGYRNKRILDIFLRSDIDHRYFYLDPENFDRHETPDQLNARYLRGALEIGREAAQRCLTQAALQPGDVDLLLVASCTGYVCPDLATRLAGQMDFRRDVERAPMVGLGCAGAMPTLQRACDYCLAHPGRKALMLAVEICSASYYLDNSLETAVGNAICADGAAAFLLSTEGNGAALTPVVMDFESVLDPSQLDKVGFEQKEGKLRIILALAVRDLAGPLVEKAVDSLLRRHGLARQDVRFWIAHPGGRKVIDNVQQHLGLTDEHVRFSQEVLRNYGNMSSPTVMFVLEQVTREGQPERGDWGVMLALGPGMAAEAALLRWESPGRGA